MKLIQREGGAFVDTAQLLASGALSGPHRKTRPLTLTFRMRLVRVLRAWWMAL